MALVRPPVSYPGVYIQEVESDVHTITPVDTATTAFIGRAARGPVNEPVICNGFADFQSIFGGLWSQSQLGYAVDDFFLNGGAKAVIVRLFHPDDATASKLAIKAAKAAATAQAAATTAPTEAKDAAKAVADAAAGNTVADVLKAMQAEADKHTASDAKDAAQAVLAAAQNAKPDDSAAIKAAKDAATAKAATYTTAGEAKDAADAVAGAATGSTLADVLKAMQDEAAKHTTPDAQAAAQAVLAAAQNAKPDDSAAIKAAKDAATAKAATYTTAGEAKDAADAVAGAATGSTLADVLKAMQDKVNTYTQRLQASSNAVNAVIQAAQAPVDVQASSATLALPVSNSGTPITLIAKNPGSWGNNLVAEVDDLELKIAAPLALVKYGSDATSFFNLRIRDTKTGAEEYFPNLTVSSDSNLAARRIDNVLEHQSDLVRVDPALFSSGTDLVRPSANASIVVADGQHVNDGIALIDTDLLGNQAEKTGMYALEHADIFNMLCIPPYAEGADDVQPLVLGQAREYCRRRRAILIVDPPSTWVHKKDAIKNYPIDGLPANSYSAIFFPRIKKADPLRENQIDTFVPCGAIAGIMARTDFRRGVWKAAAGQQATIEGIAGLSVPLTDAENGELNPLGINCMRIMPAVGPVVWGARTMEGDDRLGSQWKYIPVRRMALWIEESLYRGTQWAVFEPNDEPLWSSLRLNIGVFMNDLFRQGAFQGQSPKDAYFVKCDSSTTLQSDIDRGIVNVVVGFAPLKPAEFVILYIQQITGNLTV